MFEKSMIKISADCFTKHFSERENEAIHCGKHRIFLWKTAQKWVKIVVVSTLARLMLKVHSLVVVALQYARLHVCIGEIDPLY